MASLQTGRRPQKRWRARVKENWIEYYLGTFDTKEEAERVEREFRENRNMFLNPPTWEAIKERNAASDR